MELTIGEVRRIISGKHQEFGDVTDRKLLSRRNGLNRFEQVFQHQASSRYFKFEWLEGRRGDDQIEPYDTCVPEQKIRLVEVEWNSDADRWTVRGV